MATGGGGGGGGGAAGGVARLWLAHPASSKSESHAKAQPGHGLPSAETIRPRFIAED